MLAAAAGESAALAFGKVLSSGKSLLCAPIPIGRGPENRPVKSDRATAIDPVSTIPGASGRRRQAAVRREPTQVLQDHVQAVPLDVLHRVIVHTAVLTYSVNRHDPRVMQPGRRPRLELESLHLHRVNPAMQRQDLQGNPPPQRFLHRLVDHPHAAPTDLAEDAIFAELLQLGGDCVPAAPAEAMRSGRAHPGLRPSSTPGRGRTRGSGRPTGGFVAGIPGRRGVRRGGGRETQRPAD